MAKSKSKIGIALSGGGVRGISHLGVLKALNESGIYPDRIAGTSAGAIAGGLYAYGYAPDEILEMIKQTNFFKFIKPAISLKGIFKMESTKELYQNYIKTDDYSATKIPFTAVAVDICKGKIKYFSEGSLIESIMASSCIPGVFDPITIEGISYVDGGVLNNLPIEPLEGISEKIIAVHCNHLPEKLNLRNMKEMIERSVIMSMNNNAYYRQSKADFFIETPYLAKYGVFDIRKADIIFKEGYYFAQEYIENHPSLQSISSK
ncbi:patatin-like phospholipase family protein [Penaeicola halotolerans]|uniref:patatin-like phospholipase family protein n=1 Tax=Penaeicola halotolerans TaxID=2793196 RepID=UPI001CF8FED2|nr:patatin-like phospholipase family protein [Penaeicola halotolerans]